MSAEINYPASAFVILQQWQADHASIPQQELNAAICVILQYFQAAAVVLPYSTKS